MKQELRFHPPTTNGLTEELYHSLIDTRYFLSNYYAIRTEDKGFQGLYPFFDSQEILYEELRKLEKKYGRVRAIVDKARRMGYTTYMVGEFLHKTVIRYKHTNTVFVSQDEDGASTTWRCTNRLSHSCRGGCSRE